MVWPDPLPDKLFLPDLLNQHLTGGWNGSEWSPCRVWADNVNNVIYPVIGLYDHPSRQKQFLVKLDPAQGGGHMLVMGSAGSGK
nr:hypothetical protein [Bacteroidales bacterium]